MIGFHTRLEAARSLLLLAGRNEPEDEKLWAIKQCSTQWPLVRFTNGLVRLCVPEEFTVVGALGGVEASRTQVREHNTTTRIADFGLGTAHPRLGTQRAQIPGSDTGAGQSRPSQNFREGPRYLLWPTFPIPAKCLCCSLCRPLPRNEFGHVGSSKFRSTEARIPPFSQKCVLIVLPGSWHTPALSSGMKNRNYRIRKRQIRTNMTSI